MKEINVEIITPTRNAFKGSVKSITVPGSLGNFQILYNHAPLMSSLEIGRIKVEDLEGNRSEYCTGGGTVEVRENKILVLADSCEKSDEIDIERAKRSIERAKERLSSAKKGDFDQIRAELSLQRALNRLKLTGTAGS
jgi:F-type H+-transporting ATPase subunit epsilon